MREHCHRCRKPALVCICADVPRVCNQTEIIILQHPKEREHPFGTARFAELGLERVRTLVHERLGRSPSPLGRLPEGTLLIYPREGAPLLTAEVRPRALLFLDGTWAQSRTLYRINPVLAELPHYRLEPRVASRYQIRSEPAAHYTSTIEAIAEALSIVEPELPDLDRLVTAFSNMIDKQLDFRREPRPRQRKERKKLPSRAIPEVLREGRRIILAHGELSHGELVYLAATDLDGATFECTLKPKWPPDELWLESSGLDRTALEDGVEPSELPVRWAAFAGEGDVLAAWNRSMVEALAAATGHSLSRVVLKAAYCNQRSAAAGALEQVLHREGLTPVATPFQGRTARLLGALIPVARRLLER